MITYTKEIIDYINLFENITKTRVKDCFFDRDIIFIVHEGDAARAIGKNGVNIKRLGNMTKRRIKVIEFSNDAVHFVSNIIQPLDARVRMENSCILIEPRDSISKAKLLGKDRQNLKRLKNILSRYFALEVRVA